MKCPKCGEDCDRDDILTIFGIKYGFWYCSNCGWNQEDEQQEAMDLDQDYMNMMEG